MKYKKGFTLIELLAVIVILGVIMMIAIPAVTGYITSTRIEAYKIDMRNYSNEIVKEMNFHNLSNFQSGNEFLDISTIKIEKGKSYDVGQAFYLGGKVFFKNVTDGKFCLNGVGNDVTVTEGDCTGLEEDNTEPIFYLTLSKDGDKTIVTLNVRDDESGIAGIAYPDGSSVSLAGTYEYDGKDNTTKILIISEVHEDFEEVNKEFEKAILKYFTNVTIDSTKTYEQIISEGYDIVISEEAAWFFSRPDLLNKLYANGVSLITQGNDSNSNLDIIKSNRNYFGSYIATQIVKNEVTHNFGTITQSNDDQIFIHLSDNAESWFQFMYNDIVYDAIGYMQSDNARWLHIQSTMKSLLVTDADLLSMVYRVSGSKSASYIVDGSGEYCFKAYDLSGNVNTQCITV